MPNRGQTPGDRNGYKVPHDSEAAASGLRLTIRSLYMATLGCRNRFSGDINRVQLFDRGATNVKAICGAAGFRSFPGDAPSTATAAQVR